MSFFHSTFSHIFLSNFYSIFLIFLSHFLTHYTPHLNYSTFNLIHLHNFLVIISFVKIFLSPIENILPIILFIISIAESIHEILIEFILIKFNFFIIVILTFFYT